VHLDLGSRFETAGNCQIYLDGASFDGVADFERTSNQQYAGPERWIGQEDNRGMLKCSGQTADLEVLCSFSYYRYQIGRKGFPSQRNASFLCHFAMNYWVERIRDSQPGRHVRHGRRCGRRYHERFVC
jgi:hypothetical protein